jgi:hypothetical protein
MSYQNLIGDEVYYGSPCYEEFHTILDVKEEGEFVLLHLGRYGEECFTKIEKQDLDKFMENEYVEFMVSRPKGLSLQVLITSGEQVKRWIKEI